MSQVIYKHIVFVFITSVFIYLIDASKEFGLEVNTEKIKYKPMSRHQNAEKKHNMKTANRSFENMAGFKYLGKTLKNQNLI
jgi:hypothetical protein